MWIFQNKIEKLRHTDGANDGGATEVLRRNHLRVQLGVPFQLHTVAQVVKRIAGGHFERLL